MNRHAALLLIALAEPLRLTPGEASRLTERHLRTLLPILRRPGGRGNRDKKDRRP